MMGHTRKYIAQRHDVEQGMVGKSSAVWATAWSVVVVVVTMLRVVMIDC